MIWYIPILAMIMTGISIWLQDAVVKKIPFWQWRLESRNVVLSFVAKLVEIGVGMVEIFLMWIFWMAVLLKMVGLCGVNNIGIISGCKLYLVLSMV